LKRLQFGTLKQSRGCLKTNIQLKTARCLRCVQMQGAEIEDKEAY